MGRSVVLNRTPRCVRCCFPLAWCLCADDEPVSLQCAVDVLMHRREAMRPTSTGNWIRRLVPDAGLHLVGADGPPSLESVRRPGRTLWVLHPFGEPLAGEVIPDDVQVVLVDGSWKQASTMLRAMTGWGRTVRLPMSGESRYWLRAKQEGARFSTMEALLFFLEEAGWREEAGRLRRQFEWQVYAGLSVRGDKARMNAFLNSSSHRDILQTLLERREGRT
jgi:DTW domain-containing protein YfiP